MNLKRPDPKVAKATLREIAGTHTLHACPACGGALTSPQRFGDATSQLDTWRCEACRTTWNLSLENYTYERRAFNTYSHTLRLSANWEHACACGSSHTVKVFTATVHERCLGHAKLGESCALDHEGMSGDDYLPGGRIVRDA